MTWKTIFNPFEKFDDKTLLIVGIIFSILFILLCYWTNSCFISIYRIVELETKNISDLLFPTLISFIIPIIVLFALGKFLYRKTRMIDIANTVLLSQIPFIILLFLEKFPYLKNSGERFSHYQEQPNGTFPILDFVLMLSVMIITLLCLIYSFIILFNGFKTATNIKKWQHIALFCFVTMITVMICQIFNN